MKNKEDVALYTDPKEPKRRALELVKMFEKSVGVEHAKFCTYYAVDLYLREIEKMSLIFSDREIHLKFWKKVQIEIWK